MYNPFCDSHDPSLLHSGQVLIIPTPPTIDFLFSPFDLLFLTVF